MNGQTGRFFYGQLLFAEEAKMDDVIFTAGGGRQARVEGWERLTGDGGDRSELRLERLLKD